MSSFQKGVKLAPPLIREALYCGSMNLFAENGISIDNSNIKDRGDFDVTEYFDIEKITEKILARLSRVVSHAGDKVKLSPEFAFVNLNCYIFEQICS